MPGNDVSSEARPFIEIIEKFQQRVKEYTDFAKKLNSRLSRATKTLAKKPAVAAEVSKLIADLHGLSAEPEKASSTQLVQALEDRLRKLQSHRRESFPAELRQACEAAQLEFVSQPDGFGVGPFYVTTDWTKETASFQYARMEVLKNVAISPNAIVENATSLKSALLDVPVDFKKFGDQLHEAMRVALARNNKNSRADQLRAELPLVYQEMALIRQSGRKRKTEAEFNIPRFVVELKQFMQSDQNVNAAKQFRLETAVIENTKNPKKSLFIPRDLSRSYGEGTYYQAIVFT